MMLSTDFCGSCQTRGARQRYLGEAGNEALFHAGVLVLLAIAGTVEHTQEDSRTRCSAVLSCPQQGLLSGPE